jgi:hypothetical protein
VGWQGWLQTGLAAWARLDSCQELLPACTAHWYNSVYSRSGVLAMKLCVSSMAVHWCVGSERCANLLFTVKGNDYTAHLVRSC